MQMLRIHRRPTRRHWALLRVGALFCAMILAFGAMSGSVKAETAAEKYNRLKEELAVINDDIDSAKQNKKEAEKLKKSLAKQKAVVDEMIALKRDEIAATEADLAAKEEEIAKKREVIYENDQLFQQRLLAIYKMNTATGLSQLFNVDSFAELMRMADAMQRISKNDTDLLDLLEGERQALEAQQAEIDALLATLQDAHSELAGNADVLAGNIAAQDATISAAEAEVQAKEEAYEATHDELVKAQEEMAAIMASLGGSSQGDGSAYVGGVFIWPVPGIYNISCHFGAPDPNGTPHRGMDIHTNGAWGPPIVAAGSGLVIVAAYADSSYGNYVVLDHGDGVKTLYAHCETLTASVGQFVNAGEQIATVGSTGFSTGPHLHFEVQVGGGLQDPRGWLTA